ncbi:MAG: M14 family zinc carboxypeptidase [Phycisphaerales bacterium JB039]
MVRSEQCDGPGSASRRGRAALLALLAVAGGCASGGASRQMTPAASARASDQSWRSIGQSLEGRDLEAATFGHGPRRFYIIGGVHGTETEGQAVIAALASGLAGALASGATVRIVRDMNPDGAAAGRRGSAAGVDLNRNWPARNFRPSRSGGPAPLSEPETQAVHADIAAFGPDLIFVFHSIGSGPLVNYDGPASEAAAVFATAAAEIDPRWRIVPDMGYPTPGSLGSYYGVDQQIPILTIEMKRGDDSTEATRAALAGLEAVLQALGGAP